MRAKVKDPDVVRVAKEYRAELARGESAALNEMSRVWVQMGKEVYLEMRALALEIQTRRDTGDFIPDSFIYSMSRYQTLMAKIADMEQKYAEKAETIIRDAETSQAILGLESAQAIIRASGPSDDSWVRLNEGAVTSMIGMSRNGAPLAELLKRDYREAGQRATDALIRGVGLGKGYKSVAQEMEHALDMDFDRSVTIARTEIARAYRQAQMDQYKASNVVSRVIRLCYKPTACFACLMLDGTEVKNWILEDHPRGKCTSIVETLGGYRPTWQTGREWFERELSPEEQERLIGPGRMELWMSGAFELQDFVTIKPSETWGGNPGLIPLKELKESVSVAPYIGVHSENSKLSDSWEVLNPMQIDEYERMKEALEQQGIEVYAAVSGDDLRYMLFLGAEGTYSNNRITHVGSVPSRGTFFEEIIHMKQSKDYGELDQSDYLELYAREIEANRKLLRYNKAYKLDDLDIADIRRNLSIWEQKFQQKAGVPYDESNYRGND